MSNSESCGEKYPRYLADGGGLFGAPPCLVCQICHKCVWELFYGHCRKCAEEKDIPQKMAEPQKFHDAFERSMVTVADGIPKAWYPWWHWRRWFPLFKTHYD